MLREIFHALRSLARTPGFTALAVLTLALGIGAGTAVFSVVNAVLLRPLPYRDPDRLVRIESVRGGEPGEVSQRDLQDIKEGTSIFSGVAGYVPGGQYNTSGDGAAPEEVPATLCSRDLFDVLGVPLLHGGAWPPEYDQDRNFGIVLNHGFWQRRFGGDPGVVGRKITLDAAPFYTIFGVLPPGFDFPGRSDLFRSIVIVKRQVEDRNSRSAYGLARLKPGITVKRARAELSALAERLARSYPDTNRGLGFDVTPLTELYVGEARPYLLLLLGAVGFLLLIAGVNIVNLLLSRALARDRAVALRAALGASRSSLVRRGLLEAVLLSLAGGALGLLLAWAWVRIAAALLHPHLPFWAEIAVDARVLAFTFVLAMLTGLVAGLIPALQGSRPSLTGVLNEGGRGGSAGRGRLLLRRALVAVEISLALTLLAGAGLMGKSLARLLTEDPGFRADRLLTFRIALPWRTYDDPKTIAFYRQTLERIAALPGVETVAANSNPPLSGKTEEHKWTVTLEGQSLAAQQANPYVDEQRVTPGYFRLMGIPVLRGRTFVEADTADTGRVAVVSRRFAERFWPGQEAVGKRLKPGRPDPEVPWYQVVGVVEDVRHERLGGESGLALYYSVWQTPDANAYVLARTHVEPATLVRPANLAVWEVDREQSTFDFATMDERIAASLWRQRVSGGLLAAFAVLATVLAAVGIFGVTSFAVSQRTREIGIRMALGAEAKTVLGMVLRETAAVLAVGLMAGLAAGLVLTRLLSSLLYGVDAADPGVFAAVCLLLTAVALSAGYLPARRAARVDPLVAIRSEEADV
jgi:putative ABC transport system permease protein